MKASRDIKLKNPKADFSTEGYHAEVSAEELGLGQMSTEGFGKNELIFKFLMYVATRRVYEAAFKDGVVTQAVLDRMLEPYANERAFEQKLTAVA